MAIIFTEKGVGLHKHLLSLGYEIKHRDNVTGFSRIDGQPVSPADEDIINAAIAAYDNLPDAKELKIVELKEEGLSRIQAVFPAIQSFDDIAFQREFFLSIAPAARNPTVNFQQIIDIYQAGLNARDAINALTTVAEVEAYNVGVDPVWP